VRGLWPHDDGARTALPASQVPPPSLTRAPPLLRQTPIQVRRAGRQLMLATSRQIPVGSKLVMIKPLHFISVKHNEGYFWGGLCVESGVF